MNKKTILFAAILLIASALSFYGGAQYAAKNTNTAQGATDTTANLRQGGIRQRNPGTGGGGMLSGNILSKTDQSIVIQTRDGSSKIVFISPSTEISKFVAGATTDLEIGKAVSIFGEANPDGSENAKTVQIRPENGLRQNLPGQSATTTN